MGVQINGSEGNVIATKGTFSGDVGIGGTLTYEDVTNVDSIGIVTARTDINLGDSIIHIDDTNTKIRFPASDTVSVETSGSERFRIGSDGGIGIGNDSPTTWGGGIPTIEFKGTSGSYTSRAGAIAFESQSGSSGYNTLFSEGGNLLFYSGATNRASATERFRITSGGQTLFTGVSGTTPLDIKTSNSNNNTVQPIIESYADNSTYKARIGLVREGSSGALGWAFLTNAVGSPTERLRITSAGDLLLGGHDTYTYDDTSGTNVILDIYGGATAGKRGILSLSGRSGSDGATLGTIWFNNDNNSSGSPGNTMKLTAAIQAKSVTSDGNAQNDSGAYLQFFTKPESSSVTETMRISSQGYVTKPAHPAFRAGRATSSQSVSGGDAIIFNSTSSTHKLFNQGSHYSTSTGKFTAPVAGVYSFFTHVIYEGVSDGANLADVFHMYVNNTQAAYSHKRSEYVANTTGNNGYYTDTGDIFAVKLSAGDEVWVRQSISSMTVHPNPTYTTFSGFLIG